MNLWWRLLVLLLTTRWRSKPLPPFGVSRLTFRVWPGDLDTSLHMNNGRYWSLMDLGRTDLMLRWGLWRAIIRNRWTPVISTAGIRFQRELRAWTAFSLETRVVGWDDNRFIIRQDLVRSSDGALAATALVRGGFYDRRARSFVRVADILEFVGVDSTPPALERAEMLVDLERVLQTTRPDG